MKKNLVVCVCLFIFIVPVFGQNVDKARYAAIDPFDYKLAENNAIMGERKQYRSVVEFISEIRDNNTAKYKFISLDKRTPLVLAPNRSLKPPAPGQIVTIYYTMNMRGSANITLDAYEENANKDETGVVKSSIPPPLSNREKNEYKEISTDDYKDDAVFTQQGEDDRKFKTILQFEAQEGIIYKFSRPDFTATNLADIPMKVRRRFPPFTPGQRMVVYFTATKEDKDYLILDDIELMR